MNLQFGEVWPECTEQRVTGGRRVNTVLQTPVSNAVKFKILGIIWFISAQFGVSNGAPPSTSECHCGYGGLCFKDAVNNNPFVFDCRLCREISGKFYGSDCTNINNNCVPSPCQRGVCIPTFGSYYCKCPPDYFGKNCGYHQPILTRAGLKNEVYVYYQVQPYHDGTNNFHIVVDPLNQLKIWQEYGVSILVTVEIENGKVLYPLRDKHFAFRNIKQNCLTDSKLNPDLYDVKVCDHLPEGDVWTYTVDCTSYIPSYLEPENLVSVPRVGLIGRKQLLKLRIEVSDVTGVQEVLFEETYLTFTYSFFARIPNNCIINVRFRGCSLEKRYPSVYSLGDGISIGGISENIGCKGILDLGSEWFLQKNVERLRQYAFDRTPWKVRERRPGTLFLSFRRRYLKPGLHLVEFVHHLRGNPPMIGGTRQFNRTTGCWIRTVANTPSFGIEGGTKRTASCYQSLRLKVMLYDNNYDLSDFTFTSSCTTTLVSDEECFNRNMEGPYLNKFFTPCNTEYNYTISATHRVSITPPTEFSIQVAFIPAETELHVQCIFNCNPIDPELLVLVGAWTIPYVPQPVTWAVTMNGVPLDPKNIHTTGFQHSSRILRVDGDHFRQDGVQSVDVEFSASKGENRLYATLISMVDILDSDLTKFVLTTKTDDETHPVYGFTNVSVTDYLFNNPMTYAVYSFDDSIREMIVEVETTYIPLISFTPVLKKVTFCLMDSSLTLHTRKCTKAFYAVTSWSMPQISLAQLELESRIEDTRNFLRHAQGYLIKHLGVFDNKIMRWDISREERTEILGFMTRYKLSRQSDIMASLSVLSMMFYSENGCRDQELLRFEPEKDVLSVFNAATTWLKMNNEAIHVLKFTVVQIFNRLKENNLKMRDYGYGDIFDKLYSTWTLAFLQEAFIFSHSFKKENPTILDLYLSAAINFWRIKNNTKLNSVGMFILELVLSFQQPFYGLRFIGKGSIQAWVTKAPYSCIRSYANKSNPEGETFPKLVEYVFSSPGRPPGDWVSYFNLILPDVIPGLEYEKLSFLVVIVKNLEGNDVEIAPTLVLDLRRENGISIARLPRDNGYQVTIPEMENGELSNSSTQFTKGKFMIIKEPSRSERYDYRSVSAYKLVLPTITRKFIFFVYQDKPIPLKAGIFYGEAPDYDVIANTTDLVGEWDEVIKLYAIKFPARPPPGESVYLGMIPSPATPVGIHSFWGQEYYNYCLVSQRTETAKITDTCVPALPTGQLNKSVFWNEIRCSCFSFGLLTTHRQTLEQTRVLIEPIYFVTVKQLNVPGVLLFSLLLLTSVLAVAIAIFFDHKRGKERLLFYVDDAYPTDRSYTIVVGVFTGSNPLAWTNSSVAVKVIGSNASSRVHILRSRGRRTFMSGGDDWFVIPVSQPLGKITTVSLWLDFKCISDWYCSRIMIYEVKSSKWYFVNVERWFKMYPANEETKILSLTVTGIEQSEGHSSAFDYSFATYFFTEIRSAHLPISLFNLHRRSLSSYEEKCLVYIVKVFGVLFWTWSTLEYTLAMIFPGYSDEQLQTRVSVETQTMILLIALFSRVFTFPIEMLDRRKVISRFIQRRTTQPLFTSKDSRSHRSESGQSNPAVAFAPGVEGAQPMRFSQRADKRRSSKHSHSSADFRKKDSKGAFLHDSSWRKSIYQGRSTLVPLTVGPHQFRSVNVSLNVLEQKTRRNLMITRAFVASLLTCFLLFLAYMEFFTSYWKKTRIACFFVVLTLFFDAVFLDPFLIFVKSIIAFVFFDFSNKEVNIWNDEVKQEFGARPKLGFEQYLKKATRKEYKPLIGAAFDEKKKAFFYFKAILLCFFYAVMLIALGSCIILVKFYDTHGKWATIRSLESVFSDPISEYGNTGVKIKDVYSRPNFEEYVATNLAAADMTWSNGKFIGQNRTRWGKDHTSTPLTATNMILLLMREGTSSRQVPIELEDYLSGAVGAFSKSKQLTDPIISGEDMIFYNVTNNGSILGRSRAEYPYAGHTYSLITYPWDSYYTNMRFHVDLILRDLTINPRAIIFTTNYLNRNRPVFITVDVVVELLPSGLLSAIARVSSSIAYSSRFLETTILRTSMTLVVVAMCLLNIYLLCKPTDYIGKWLTCRMWVFFLSCFASATFLGCIRHKKYVVLNTISLSYDDQFIDIQYIYTIDLWDQCLMSVVIFVISVELAVQVYGLMGSGRIAAIAASSFRTVLAVFMVAIYLIAIYEICHYHADPRLQPIVLFVFMKQLLPLISENIIYVLRDVPGLINSIIITVIMAMKFSTAIAVYYSLTLDVDRPSVIRYILFHGLLRKKGGGAFEPRSISDGFRNYSPLMPTINKQTNDNKFQLNIDEEKQPIQLLGSNIDGKLSWLINK